MENNQRNIANNAGLDNSVPCDNWPDERSVKGMTVDQIQSRFEEYIRDSSSKAKVSKYYDVKEYLYALSEILGYQNMIVVNLSHFANACWEEERYTLQGNMEKANKSNKLKWIYLNAAKVA